MNRSSIVAWLTGATESNTQAGHSLALMQIAGYRQLAEVTSTLAPSICKDACVKDTYSKPQSC